MKLKVFCTQAKRCKTKKSRTGRHKKTRLFAGLRAKAAEVPARNHPRPPSAAATTSC